MTRPLLAAMAFACALLWPAAAEARPCRCARVVPVSFEGVGTLWICVRPPRRR